MGDGFSSGIVTVWASQLMFYYLLYNQMAEKIPILKVRYSSLLLDALSEEKVRIM